MKTHLKYGLAGDDDVRAKVRIAAVIVAAMGAILSLSVLGAASAAWSQSAPFGGPASVSLPPPSASPAPSASAPVAQLHRAAPIATPDAARDNQFDEYTLGSGDKVRINVYGEDTLSGEFLVSGEGKVSMPLVGDVKAAGLTVNAFQEELRAALAQDYLKNPKVSVEVINYRPFYILGEVSKPGEYPYTHGLTVFNAVATAGGFTYRANQRRVFIRGKSDTREHGVELTGTTLVTPGDTIRIGERLF